MTLLLGATTIGLILALLALGVYLSFRIFNFPDITADGSITFGASVTAVLLVHHWSPWMATLAGFVAGTVAGATTRLLHTDGGDLNVMGWSVGVRDAAMLVAMLGLVSLVGLVLYLFFRTNLGTAMRAAGDNPQMIRALGVSVDFILILGLALSNGLIALAGALLAQYQGFADVQMGIGMVVWGLASVIIGRALVGSDSLGNALTGTIMGSVLFRLIIAVALRWGLNPNDLKLVTAIFVFGALVLPQAMQRMRTR